MGGAHRRGARATAPSPRPGSWWASPATSTPTSPCPAAARCRRPASPRWRCSPPTGARATSPGSCGRQLDALADERVPVALLVAAEWPIYGRFGYGPAIDACALRDRHRRRRGSVAAPRARSSWSTPTDAAPGARGASHEARRRRTPGAIRREPMVWDRIAGLVAWPGQTFDAGAAPRRAVARRRRRASRAPSPTRSTTRGRATARPARPRSRLLVGATAGGRARALAPPVRDRLGQTVSAGNRGVDDPLPLLLDRRPSRGRRSTSSTASGRGSSTSPPPSARAGRATGRPSGGRGHRRPRASRPAAGASTSRPTGPRSRRRRRRPMSSLPVARARRPVPRRALGARLHEAGWLDEAHPGRRRRASMPPLRTATAPWSPTTY